MLYQKKQKKILTFLLFFFITCIISNVCYAEKSSLFFKKLYEQKIVTIGDLIKISPLLILEAPEILTFSSAINLLKDKKIIPQKWNPNPDNSLKKGFMSNILFRIIKFKTGYKGSLNIRLFGISDRYSYKELTNMKIVSPGGKGKTVSGGDLVASFTQTDNFISKKGGK